MSAYTRGAMVASICLSLALLAWLAPAHSQPAQEVVDIPTRAGVTQRLLVLAPRDAKAAVVLFAGGHGGLQLRADGSFGWGESNFVVRTRRQFAQHALIVAVVDAPSDRQSLPFLTGFRQTPEHVADIKEVIAWLRKRANVPVWLIGTSRGTQSAAYVATQLNGAEGPDGLVLTSTILSDKHSRPVPAMQLENLRIPVLVVHHRLDGCKLCAYDDLPALMEKLRNVPRKQLLSFQGGESRGDPCKALAYHGYNGIEAEVVKQIAAWILAE